MDNDEPAVILSSSPAVIDVDAAIEVPMRFLSVEEVCGDACLPMPTGVSPF